MHRAGLYGRAKITEAYGCRVKREYKGVVWTGCRCRIWTDDAIDLSQLGAQRLHSAFTGKHKASWRSWRREDHEIIGSCTSRTSGRHGDGCRNPWRQRKVAEMPDASLIPATQAALERNASSIGYLDISSMRDVLFLQLADDAKACSAGIWQERKMHAFTNHLNFIK